MTILLFWFSLQFTGSALANTAGGVCAVGLCTAAGAGAAGIGSGGACRQPAAPGQPHRVQPRAGYTSFAVAAFRTESGQYIEARLPEPWPGAKGLGA